MGDTRIGGDARQLQPYQIGGRRSCSKAATADLRFFWLWHGFSEDQICREFPSCHKPRGKN
jgi:hypothetical protein